MTVISQYDESHMGGGKRRKIEPFYLSCLPPSLFLSYFSWKLSCAVLLHFKMKILKQ